MGPNLNHELRELNRDEICQICLKKSLDRRKESSVVR